MKIKLRYLSTSIRTPSDDWALACLASSHAPRPDPEKGSSAVGAWGKADSLTAPLGAG
jgi:hypothetical protein